MQCTMTKPPKCSLSKNKSCSTRPENIPSEIQSKLMVQKGLQIILMMLRTKKMTKWAQSSFRASTTRLLRKSQNSSISSLLKMYLLTKL
jgi:hypothetical protein